MSSFVFLLVCMQACFIQNAYSHRWCGAEPFDYGYGYAADRAFAARPYSLSAELAAAELAAPGLAAAGLAAAGLAAPGLLAPGLSIPPIASAYGGTGIGDLAIAGELPVAGTTAIAGQVPILGAVEFGGRVPAAGAVTIAGNSGCGCGANIPWQY